MSLTFALENTTKSDDQHNGLPLNVVDLSSCGASQAFVLTLHSQEKVRTQNKKMNFKFSEVVLPTPEDDVSN